MKSLKHSDTETLDRAYCLPTGSLFVSEDVLKGVLPSVLDEILSTRAMLKKAAKEYKRVLPKPPVPVLRQLEARQLALKYVANVTCKLFNFFLCSTLSFSLVTLRNICVSRWLYVGHVFRKVSNAFIGRCDCRKWKKNVE